MESAKDNKQCLIFIFISIFLAFSVGTFLGYFIFQKTEEKSREKIEKSTGKSSNKLILGQSNVSLKTRYQCPEDMVIVEGYTTGWFWIRQDDSTYLRKKGKPRKIETFCMDKFEYPNILHHFPKTEVSYFEAKELCEQSGKRLCTEHEWERACIGDNEWEYSYGPEKELFRCNTDGVEMGDDSLIAPCGSHPGCKNKWGVYDLNGNVSEWVEENEPGNHGVLRGGTAWKTDAYGQSCFSRHAHLRTDNTWKDDGFRCCAKVEPNSMKIDDENG